MTKNGRSFDLPIIEAHHERGGVAEQLFRVMHVWSGPLRGGLAVGTILSGTVLSAMIGIVGAEVVTLGLVALPEMLRRGSRDAGSGRSAGDAPARL